MAFLATVQERRRGFESKLTEPEGIQDIISDAPIFFQPHNLWIPTLRRGWIVKLPRHKQNEILRIKPNNSCKTVPEQPTLLV